MKKTLSAKLKLSRETLSNLDASALDRVDGGGSTIDPPPTYTCRTSCICP